MSHVKKAFGKLIKYAYQQGEIQQRIQQMAANSQASGVPSAGDEIAQGYNAQPGTNQNQMDIEQSAEQHQADNLTQYTPPAIPNISLNNPGGGFNPNMGGAGQYRFLNLSGASEGSSSRTSQ